MGTYYIYLYNKVFKHIFGMQSNTILKK